MRRRLSKTDHCKEYPRLSQQHLLYAMAMVRASAKSACWLICARAAEAGRLISCTVVRRSCRETNCASVRQARAAENAFSLHRLSAASVKA